jgi:hypothetical protein
MQFETKCTVPKNILLEQMVEQSRNAVSHQIFEKYKYNFFYFRCYLGRARVDISALDGLR